MSRKIVSVSLFKLSFAVPESFVDFSSCLESFPSTANNLVDDEKYLVLQSVFSSAVRGWFHDGIALCEDFIRHKLSTGLDFRSAFFSYNTNDSEKDHITDKICLGFAEKLTQALNFEFKERLAATSGYSTGDHFVTLVAWKESYFLLDPYISPERPLFVSKDRPTLVGSKEIVLMNDSRCILIVDTKLEKNIITIPILNILCPKYFVKGHLLQSNFSIFRRLEDGSTQSVTLDFDLKILSIRHKRTKISCSFCQIYPDQNSVRGKLSYLENEEEFPLKNVGFPSSDSCDPVNRLIHLLDFDYLDSQVLWVKIFNITLYFKSNGWDFVS